jgi:hypothetical protein
MDICSIRDIFGFVGCFRGAKTACAGIEGLTTAILRHAKVVR